MTVINADVTFELTEDNVFVTAPDNVIITAGSDNVDVKISKNKDEILSGMHDCKFTMISFADHNGATAINFHSNGEVELMQDARSCALAIYSAISKLLATFKMSHEPPRITALLKDYRLIFTEAYGFEWNGNQAPLTDVRMHLEQLAKLKPMV